MIAGNELFGVFETGPLWGGYCEETHLPEVNVVKIPEGVSYDDASSCINDISYIMGICLLEEQKIQPGQLVFDYGWQFRRWKLWNSNRKTFWMYCNCYC